MSEIVWGTVWMPPCDDGCQACGAKPVKRRVGYFIEHASDCTDMLLLRLDLELQEL